MVDANQKWGRAQAIEWMKQVLVVVVVVVDLTSTAGL